MLKINSNNIFLLIRKNNKIENYEFNQTIKDFISFKDFLLNNINIIFVSTKPDMNPKY